IGVAFDEDVLLCVAGQVRGMHFNQAAILVRDGVAVKVEVNRTLLGERALWVEWVHDLPSAGRVGATGARAAGLVKWYRTTCCQRGGKCGDGKAFCDARAH